MTEPVIAPSGPTPSSHLRADPGRRSGRWNRRAFDDRSAVLLAIAACAGAWAALSVIWWLGVLVVVGGLVAARSLPVVVGVAVLCSGLAATATTGLAVEPGPWNGTVEVVRVTTTRLGDVHAEVRAGDRHFDLVATVRTRATVASARPGDRLVVAGRVAPTDPVRSRRRGSHVAGRFHPERIEPGGAPRFVWRIAGAARDGVKALGGPLPPSQRALFEGFVLGDASGQTAVQQADFRASGLTHLLVASGENVAFVLLLAAPLLMRCGLRSRWALTVGLCALYALVTGLEPSVLRAATMAVVATTAAGIGRPVRSWRTLGYAVTLLVIADPFLVHSSAFGLSVGASVGILALARPLVAVAPGPGWLRRPLAVTVAAQLGVAPFLLGFPGGMPVAAFPANLLAAVPAGFVMVLGLPALAIVATGLPGTGVFVWVPRVLLGWVDSVARWTATLDLGHLEGAMVVAVTVGVTAVVVVGRERLTWLRRAGYLLAGIGLGAPLILGTSGAEGVDRGPGPVVVRRAGAVVVVLTGEVPDEPLLTGLSVARVRRIDLVVVPHGDAGDRAMLATIAHRHLIGRVLTPARLTQVAWPQQVVTDEDRVHVGRAVVEVVATEPVLSVHVVRRGDG